MTSNSRKCPSARYVRANDLIESILNKFHNGSRRAVDPFVLRSLQEHESKLMGIQCFLEQGPVEHSRRIKDESHVAVHTIPTRGICRLFTICGSRYGSDAIIMRQWEACSGSIGEDDKEAARAEYLAVVDKILPGWDEAELDHPVASLDRFWEDDTSAKHCPLCLVAFSVQERRHHCRLCFAIFCGTCCGPLLEIALCPGAPVRAQRVCRPCFQAEYRTQQLREVKKLGRENQELEQQICIVLATAKHALATKQEEERRLRTLAIDAGCDVQALDEAVQAQLGGLPISFTSMELLIPPAAHRFASTKSSVEAASQLTLAHRQLVMSFKMAQCRAHRVLDKMDATIAALQEAVDGQKLPAHKASSSGLTDDKEWEAIVRRIHSFLTPSDQEILQIVSNELRDQLQSRSSNSCGISSSSDPSLAILWQDECLKDGRTRTFVTDLAEAVCARLDPPSCSDTEDTEDSDANMAPLAPTGLLWEQPIQQVKLATESIPTTSEFKKAYELIRSQCERGPASEWDEQIRVDVTRTFGISARRQYRNSLDLTSRIACNSTGVVIPVEKRRAALQNVLRSCASVETEVEYCQGMNHVAVLLLAVSDWNEARAFWLLVSLLSSPRYELERLYGPELEHLSLRCFQLEQLMRIHLRPLSVHFQAIEFPVSIVATGWFMTLFTSMEVFSYDVLIQVFEGFLLKGWKQLLQTALVVLAELKRPLFASAYDEIPRLFYDIQEYAPRLLDTDYVMAQCAKYDVSNDTLKRLEKEFEQNPRVGEASTTSCKETK